MRNRNLSKLTLGGIYLAITVVFLVAASFVPGVEMTLFALTSAVMAFMIVEGGVKYGAVLFGAASILGFVLLPNKLAILPYIMFFGLYPIIKFYAEKPSKAAIQLLIKFAYFVGVLLVAYFALFEVFFGSIRLPGWFPVVGVIPAAIAVFLLLDAILTVIIRIYVERVQRNR